MRIGELKVMGTVVEMAKVMGRGDGKGQYSDKSPCGL